MRIVLSGRAAADIDRLRSFLAEKDAKVAALAVAALAAAIESLAAFPERGRPIGAVGLRELIVPFGNLAYVVRYFHSRRRDALVILRIWHGREERD